MADIVKQILAKPIQLADQITKFADEAHSSKQECAELKAKTEKLAGLLRQAARASGELYERPARRIIVDTEQVLEKALILATKCRANGLMKRVFTIIPAAAFKKMSSQLENSIGDVSWLLRVSATADDRGEYLGLPPIAANEPILCLIWEQIATLHNGTLDEKADAAASLASLARDNDRYGKLIIEEGGVLPLLKLVKEGKLEGQENAARAIGLLGRDPESVETMILAGVCSVFAKILKEGPMKVQSMVAWAVSELASNHTRCQDDFAQNNIIRLLVSHLAFETVQEHSKYAVAGGSKGMSIHSVASTLVGNNEQSSNPWNTQVENHDKIKTTVAHPLGNHSKHSQMQNLVNLTLSVKNNQKITEQRKIEQNPNHHKGFSSSVQNGKIMKGREHEDPAIKSSMKAMAAKALWKLAQGNAGICRNITESKALLCLAVLLEKGTEEVQYNSAMALMEIAAVAEKDPELRRSAFKPSSPAAKAVLDQVLSVIEKADSNSNLLVPCIKAIGCLARTFPAKETRLIGPLVRLLDEREGIVMRETAIALSKFASTENYNHIDLSKAMINEGGARHLVQLVYFGEQIVQLPSLVLLCYIALSVPDSEELARAEVLKVIEWASKQGNIVQDFTIDALLPEAKRRLDLYQSRGSRGYH